MNRMILCRQALACVFVKSAFPSLGASGNLSTGSRYFRFYSSRSRFPFSLSVGRSQTTATISGTVQDPGSRNSRVPR